MTTYAAEVTTKSAPADVQRVIVGTVAWAEQNLGGEWVETSDPYSPDPQSVNYTGPGQKYDPGVVERFTGDVWTSDKATVPDSETGEYFYNTEGMLTWHTPTGKIWRNLSPTGTPNVWEPGVANWREYPMGDTYPLWVQPVGSVDAYPQSFIVEHNGGDWISMVEANVWEPGGAGIGNNIWSEYPIPGSQPMSQMMPPPPIDWQFYTVQAGDTLSALVAQANQRPNAEDFTVAQALEWNGIGDADLIFEGQVLRYI